MQGVWWALPGPSAAIRRAVDDLQDGRSVVIILPRAGWPSAQAEVMRKWRTERWRRLQACGSGTAVSPCEQVVERFCPDIPIDVRHDVAALLKSRRVGGLQVAVTIRASDLWAEWWAFLREIDLLGKDLSPLDRPIFLVELAASALGGSEHSGVTVALEEWQDTVSPSDMSAYATITGSRSPEPDHVKLVRQAVVCELALWDPELADALSALPLQSLMQPIGFLAQYGRILGWKQGPLEPDDSAWQDGRVSRVAGKARWHSAALAQVDGGTMAMSRVWRGQVTALFPLIEELRVAAVVALEHAGRNGRWPGDGAGDLRALEVGQLWQLLWGSRTLPESHRWLLEAVGVLRDIRNALAHRQPVAATTILHPSLSRLVEFAAQVPDLAAV